jgi:hypothetical protein
LFSLYCKIKETKEKIKKKGKEDKNVTACSRSNPFIKKIQQRTYQIQKGKVHKGH